MTSVVFQVDTNVSEEHIASIIRVESYSFNNSDGYACKMVTSTQQKTEGGEGGRGLCKWEKWAACNTFLRNASIRLQHSSLWELPKLRYRQVR
jgi:hypothetical protein